MLGTHDLGLFALTVLVLNATPGVDMAFTFVATLRGGVRGGLAAALGVCAGCVLHLLAAAFGMAALLAASASAFALLKWAGAAYLLWLAVGFVRQGLRPPRDALAADAPVTPDTRRLLRQGFVTNVLNPKVALFFLALLPQFIDADAPSKGTAFLFLGAWAIAQGALFLAAFVLAVAPLARMRPHPGLQRGLHFAGAGLFAWLAARLAASARA